jgi:rSAM-associated Gly-rich repeat protein
MSINSRSGLFAFLMVLATLQIPAGQASAGAGAEAPGNPASAGSITGSITGSNEARLQRISAALREQGLQGGMDATAPGADLRLAAGFVNGGRGGWGNSRYGGFGNAHPYYGGGVGFLNGNGGFRNGGFRNGGFLNGGGFRNGGFVNW